MKTSYYTDYRANAGRSFDRSTEGWESAPVPVGFSDQAQGLFGLSWDQALGRGLYDRLFQREQKLEQLRMADPRMEEMLQPETIAKEFPYLELPVKAPTRRGELVIQQNDDIWRRRVTMSLSGRNTSYIPSLGFTLGAGFTAAALDPLTYVTAWGSIGLLSSIPRVRTAATAAVASKSFLARRGSSAAIGALDGFVGNSIYGLVNMPVQRGRGVDYDWTDYMDELWAGAGLGFFLGGSFPQIADLHLPRALRSGDAGVFISNLNMLKNLLNSKDGVHKFWKSQGGFVDMEALAKFLSGRSNIEVRRPIEEIIKDQKLTDVRTTGIDFTNREITRSTSDQMYRHQFKGGYAFDKSLSLGPSGVNRIFGFSYGRRNARPWFRSDMKDTTISRPNFDTTTGINKEIVQYDDLYLALPENVSSGKNTMFLTDSPRGSVLYELMTRQGSKAPDIKVFQVALETGPSEKRAARFYDLNNPDLVKAWSKVKYGVKTGIVERVGDVKVKYADMPEVRKAAIRDAFLSLDNYDGIAYELDGRRVFEFKRSGWNKIKGVSSNYMKYNLAKQGEMITKSHVRSFLDILEGKSDDAYPPSVREVLQDYYNQFDKKLDGEQTFYEKYMRRIHPAEVKASIRLGNTTTIGKDTVKFNSDTNFYSLDKSVWQDTFDIIKTMGLEGKLTTRINTVDHLISTVFENSLDKVTNYVKQMKSKGYKFPTDVSIFHQPSRWFLLNDRVLTPLSKGESVISVLRGNRRDHFKGVKLSLKSMEYRLDVNPLHMVEGELEVLKALVDNDNVPLDVDPFKNTQTFQGKDSSTILEHLREINPHLRAMGVSNVRYTLPDGDHLFRVLGGDEGANVRADATNLAEAFDNLKKKKVVTPEGDTAPVKEVDERKAAKLAYLNTLAGQGPTLGINNIVRDLFNKLGRSDELNLPIQNLFEEYVGYKDYLENNPLTEDNYKDIYAKKVALEEDFRKIHERVSNVLDGGVKLKGYDPDGSTANKAFHKGLDIFDRLKGKELLNLFKYNPDAPYRSLGGDNVHATQSHIERVLTVSMFRRIEQAGGQTLYKKFFSGYLDDDIYKIEDYYKTKLRESQGVHGTSAEDAKQSLNVSEDAFKIHKILTDVTNASQRFLTDAGMPRKALPNYIGAVSYDTVAILKTPKNDFIKDLLEHTGADIYAAESLYQSFVEGSQRLTSLDAPIDDLRNIVDKSREIVYKSGESKSKFLKKYGLVKKKGEFDRLWNSGSNVMAGLRSSIQNDSNLAAVVSWWGTRPFIAFDAAHAAMSDKILKGFETGKGRKDVLSSLKGTKHLGERLLKEYVFGQPRSISALTTARRNLMRAVSAAVLGAGAKFVAVLSDFGLSALHLSKLEGRNIFSTIADGFKKRLEVGVPFIHAEKRKNIARRANLILSTELSDYTAKLRTENDPTLGLGSWLYNKAMYFTGLPYVTDVGLGANSTYMGMSMGDAFKYPMSRLHKDFTTALLSHGIDAKMWDYIRKLPDVSLKYDGIDMVFQDQLWVALSKKVDDGSLTRTRAEDIYRRYDTHMNSIASEKSIPHVTAYERHAYNAFTDDPDSVMGNTAATVMQFKIIAATAFRSQMDATSGKRLGESRDFAMTAIAKSMAVMTVMGGATVMLKDLSQGKSTREWDKRFFYEAMLRGGVFGLMGDMVFGERSSYFGGWAGTALGPTVSGPIFGAVSTVNRLFHYDLEESLDSALDTLGGLVPSVNPMWQFMMNSLFLHYWGALSGNLRSRQNARSRLKELDQEFLFD